MLIRVGLDQWIMVDGTHSSGPGQPAEAVGLNTAGLSGCVAVGMRWGDKISLAHVFSDCTAATWAPADGSPGYLHALNEAVRNSRELLPHAELEAVLYYSEGTPSWLPSQLYGWLSGLGVDAPEESAPTCRIWIDHGRLRWSDRLAGDPANTNHYTTSANAAAPILLYQALSANAAPATPPQGEG